MPKARQTTEAKTGSLHICALFETLQVYRSVKLKVSIFNKYEVELLNHIRPAKTTALNDKHQPLCG
ncbi:MAG: hypothetical protein NVS4B8_05290 [Herpetosiphon sp.]